MFAIVDTGGRQEKVTPGTVVVVDRLDLEPGAEYTFEHVLLVEKADGGVLTLIVNGRGHRLRVEDERERAARRISSSRSASSHRTVKSPMPGIVRAIQVAEGQLVKKGAALLVLEAMKMENEIAAEADGVIEKMHVAPGVAVNPAGRAGSSRPAPGRGRRAGRAPCRAGGRRRSPPRRRRGSPRAFPAR